MTIARSLKWLAGALLLLVVLTALFIAIYGWNWLRQPIEQTTLDKTGRQLVIGGDIEVEFGWPLPRLRAGSVSFANPAWASEKQMVTSEMVEVAIDLPQLLRQNIVLPEVALRRPVIFLEQGADGRKNWLLDREQMDEVARLDIGRLTLDQGSVGYDDVRQRTSIRATLSTVDTQTVDAALRFSAQGRYKGMPIKAHGTGGPVLGLRDEQAPYPLQGEFTVGRTGAKVDGTITSLLEFSAVDMRLAMHGANLAQLYPLLGIAFPETRAYKTEGRLVHSGQTWRYEKFSGRVGESDIAGTIEVDTGGKRPALKADLVSLQLELADLGLLIGARSGSVQAAKEAAPAEPAAVTPAKARVLPDLPFKTERWDSVDAEVTLKARTVGRAEELPLEDLDAHLILRDSVLTLDPLKFGVAGGHLDAVISLDGRHDPIQAQAKLRARKLQIARLLPSADPDVASIGQINGEFDLAGTGNSVGRMLATSDGKLGLVVTRGEISRLMMEKAGLHLWEILQLTITGDRLIKLRCAVANFDVKDGIMHTEALIFDTEVTTLFGSGNIDLAQEKLDLTFNQKTKKTSPLALRSPIHLRGTFARPEAGVDKGRVATRAAGALALGVVNPLLALLPLIDAGTGSDSDCRQLIREARALPRPPGTGKPASGPAAASQARPASPEASGDE